MRDNPEVKKHEHLTNKYPRNHFFEHELLVKNNSCVVDSKGNVFARIFSQIIPENYIVKLETTAALYANKIAASRKATVEDSRGKHMTVKFGSYLERGGSGNIFKSNSIDGCSSFIQDIDEIGKLVNFIFSKVCLEVALQVHSVPEEYKLWNHITLLFWNLTDISLSHVDSRDMQWCIVVSFGNFTGGEVDLQYLNCKLIAQRRDIYLLKSPKIYHNISTSFGNRQSLVFTNHNGVIARFCTKSVPNYLDTINLL